MARTNVYVSDELKARMDAVAEPVNWSQVAAAAFEARLAQIVARKGVENMDDVVARLKASKAECESEEHEAGFESGKDWAERQASWRELDRLTTATSESNFWDAGGDSVNWPRLVLVAMNPAADDWRASDISDFWKDQCDADPSLDWLGGFCDGALEVFNEVAGKV